MVAFNEASWFWHKETTNPRVWTPFEEEEWSKALDTTRCPVCLTPGLSSVGLGRHRVVHNNNFKELKIKTQENSDEKSKSSENSERDSG